MSKTAFIFPGQGAQYVGMAKDFYETYPECKEIIDKADELMDFDLKHILFEENDLINKCFNRINYKNPDTIMKITNMKNLVNEYVDEKCK